MEIPEKVLKACEALMPHLAYLALTGADPERQLPIPIWMHRGCMPFISREHFETIYWPTLRPIVDALWAQGNQVLLYAEGKWDAHLERFAELPAGSMIYHLDRTDPVEAHRVLGRRFCLSGGVPNALLAFGTADEVKACCRKLIETIGAEGGYIMDASAIMQNDATIENLRAMTDATLEYGVYRARSSPAPPVADARDSGVGDCAESPPRHLFSLRRKADADAADPGRPRHRPCRLGRSRRFGVLVHLAPATEFLAPGTPQTCPETADPPPAPRAR